MPKIAFFSNYINHHQLPFAKEMVKITGNNFYFISQKAISEKRIALGYRNISDDYSFVVKTYENKAELDRAYALGLEADYVIFGATKDDYVAERLRQNKITFEYSERLNKRKPSIFLWLKKYGSIFRNPIRLPKWRLSFLSCWRRGSEKESAIKVAEPDAVVRFFYYHRKEE